jgi:trigger factor
MLTQLASQNKRFAAKEGKTVKAATGDRLIIDFVGKIDDVAFEGGSGTDVPLELGSNSFIPGFEEQLVGTKVGQDKQVKVAFPAEYGAAHLAGKDAVFDVTVKGIEAPAEVVIDDELAKAFGMESLDQLKERVKENIANDYAVASHSKVKKQLLDALDSQYSFELPPTLLEQEFAGVWQQVLSEHQQSGKTFADEDTTEEAARVDYMKIAERRVRLGLVLAEIGEQAKVSITNEEVSQAVMARAQQFPGQERMVWDYYQKNPQALNEIRAPLFEEKVVTHIISQAKVTESKVTKEALLADDEADASAKKAKPAKAKATKAKEAKADDAAGEAAEVAAKPKTKAKKA